MASSAGSSARTGQEGKRKGTAPAAKQSGAANRSDTATRSMNAVYWRRRIVVVIALVAVLAVVAWSVYSLGRGVVAASAVADGRRTSTLIRDAVPTPDGGGSAAQTSAQVNSSKAPKYCNADHVTLELQADVQSAPLAGSVKFNATVRHKGSGSCLVDASDASRVLTITSGDDTVWQSNVCPSAPRKLLMASVSDMSTDTQAIVWNADRTGTQCKDDSVLPRVDRGTYVAQLSLKDHPQIVSNKVTVSII